MTINNLIGTKIKRIFFNEKYLKFITDKETFVFYVSAGCCSRSIFYDFIGVKKLLTNGQILEVNPIDLVPDDIHDGKYGMKIDKKSSNDDIKVYGYELVTEDLIFGKVTSVFSFRNYSNGYYGGDLEDHTNNIEVNPEIFDDVFESSLI